MIRTRPPFSDPPTDSDMIGLPQAALSGWTTGPLAALEALIDRWEDRA